MSVSAKTVPGTPQQATLAEAVSACRTAFVGVAIFSAGVNLLMLAVPIYMMQMFDRVISTRNVDTLIALTVMVVGALLVLGGLEAVRGRAMARVGIWLDKALSAEILNSAVVGALRFGRVSGAQGLRDLSSMRNYLGGPGVFPFFDAPFVPVFLFVVYLVHPVLGIIAFVGAVVLFSLALANEFSTRGPLREANAQALRALNEADAAVRNADVIEALGMMPNLQRRWREGSDTVLGLQGSASDRGSSISATARFLRLVLQVAMLGTGAYLVTLGQITGGAMIAASIIGSRAMAPVEQSINGWKAFVAARSAYRRVKDLMARTPVAHSDMSLPPPKGQLTVEGVIYVPPGASEPVLRGISFQIEPGTALGLIGPSSAGKTTLARLIVGSIAPTRGVVRLDGADMSVWKSSERGRHVGYLPQDVELFNGTVRENIARMGEATDAEVVAAAQLAGVHEMILSLAKGYDTPIGDGGVVLSGGRRQRIALARAVFGAPKLVVLDEPNSNLDAAGEQALAETVAQLRQAGATIVLIAHRPSLMGLMDKMLVLREGQAHLFGDRQEILQKLQRPMAVAGGNTEQLRAAGGAERGAAS